MLTTRFYNVYLCLAALLVQNWFLLCHSITVLVNVKLDLSEHSVRDRQASGGRVREDLQGQVRKQLVRAEGLREQVEEVSARRSGSGESLTEVGWPQTLKDPLKKTSLEKLATSQWAVVVAER